MLNIDLIRENPDKVKEGISKKQVNPSLVDDFLKHDENWRELRQKGDDLRSEQNEISEKLSGEKDKDLIKKAKKLKKEIKEIDKKEKEFQEKRQSILEKIPNIPFEDVTVGESEEDNKVVKEEGQKPDFSFEPKDHMEIGRDLGLIDTEKASKVTGSRFNYLKGDAVLLEFALVQLALKTLIDEGFTPIIPPVMSRPETMKKMGKGKFLKENDAFYIKDDELYLVGSSEHTIGPFHMDDVLNKEDLPKRYVGFSTCFRREAGSYGKDTKGIFRVHQFDKVEMLSFAHPDKSEEEHEKMVSIQEKLIKKLELPYRLVEISTGDMTWADARQFDVETWIPSQEKYRETNSCSNTTDFQSRGINAQFETEEGDKELVHMLNGTVFAIGRMIIAILENYQTENGDVKVPEALQAYIGKEKISNEENK